MRPGLIFHSPIVIFHLLLRLTFQMKNQKWEMEHE